MRDDASPIGHENDRPGDPVPGFVGKAFIYSVKGLDDRRIFVGQQCKLDIASFGKVGECRHFVETDRGDRVAEGCEFADPFVPGDRLNLTTGSPIERPGEQQD